MSVVASACGGGSSSSSSKVAVPLARAPEPAVSPAAPAKLPGSVLALAGAPEGIAVTRSGTVAVAVRQPDAVVLFNVSTPTDRQTVPLTGSARHLFLGSVDGPLLIPQESDDRFVAMSLPEGQVLESVPVGRQPHDSIAVGPDTVFVADELADSIHVVRNGAVTRVVPAPIQPGGMASAPDGSVMVTVGVRGRRITAYRTDGTAIGSANCGDGPTHAVTGAGGLYWVVDTNGGAILGFRVDDHGPHQVARIPVGDKPYGIAYDTQRSTLWVTLTAGNQLVGLHLNGASVSSRTTYATVRQPNTVAVDDAGGLIITGSTAQGSLQFIPPGEPS
jgi:DNA-binding beta-propeller fold protein YncE